VRGKEFTSRCSNQVQYVLSVSIVTVGSVCMCECTYVRASWLQLARQTRGSFQSFMGPDSLLKLITMFGPKCPNFKTFYTFQIHVKQLELLLYRHCMFQLNQVAIHFNEIHMCMCLWQRRTTIYINPLKPNQPTNQKAN
jgi:hypothetical protein